MKPLIQYKNLDWAWVIIAMYIHALFVWLLWIGKNR